VDVLRGVGVALRGGVGEGVQVGNIWTRFVALGMICVGGAGVGVDVEVAQLESNRMKPKKYNLICLMPILPSDCVSSLHPLPAHPVTVA
jgi:hypothetical protein